MDDVLDLLIEVQALDDAINDTNSKIEKIPDKITKLEEEIEEAKTALQEKQMRIQDIKKAYKMKEGDCAENENKIKKLNTQTTVVKTNEEYRAMISEIAYLKNENKNIEDEMMNLLEEEEQLKNTIGKIETETNKFVDEKTDEISLLKKNKDELVKKFEQLKDSFDNSFAKLPHDVRGLYEKIKKVRGNAVALIENETCAGCSSILTPQFLNELKKRSEILLCDNCGRILIYAVPDKSK